MKERLPENVTRAVNCRRTECDVYIGRPSKWGNPFVIGRDGTRDEVIAKYERYVVTKRELIAALPELKGKVLGCYCRPKACHGDVLAKLADADGRIYVDFPPEQSVTNQ